MEYSAHRAPARATPPFIDEEHEEDELIMDIGSALSESGPATTNEDIDLDTSNVMELDLPRSSSEFELD